MIPHGQLLITHFELTGILSVETEDLSENQPSIEQIIMNSSPNYSNCNGAAAGSANVQTSWPGLPGHSPDSLRQTNYLLTRQSDLDHHHNRFPESLGQFYTKLLNVSEDAQKITAMSPGEVRTFLTHGNSHIDDQVLEDLFETMQGVENQFYNLRRLVIPFALASPETSPVNQSVTFEPELSDDDDELPKMLSPARSLTADDSPTSAVNLTLDNNIPTPSPISETAPAARARQSTCQANKKQGAINRELQIPESLTQILDDIISCGIDQRHRSGYQEDIISCYKRLADSSTGGDIVELLRAVLLPDTEAQACTDLFALQQRIARNESSITIDQLRDLKHYLESQVFNGKKVNFTLLDMSHYLNLNAKPAFFDNFPPALAHLVSYLVETTLTIRATETVALKKWIFLKQLQHSENGRLAVKLLGAIAATPPDYNTIRGVQSEVNIGDEGYPVMPANYATINKLQKYFQKHFFAPWLFAFDVSELSVLREETTTERPKRKARHQATTGRDRKKAKHRSRGIYYLDPTYISHSI